MELMPIDENGFWAIVYPDNDQSECTIGGFVSTVRIGPFDFIRLDYTLAGVRDGLFQPFAGSNAVDDATIHTVLYPPDALPVISIATEEEVYGTGRPT